LNTNFITPSEKQTRLLKLAAIFVILFALILTLSPAGRERTWNVAYRWSHWGGVAIWVISVFLVNRQLKRHLHEFDPYIFPAISVLAGWGLLTIWRISPAFGLRQSIWLAVSAIALIIGMRLPASLAILRRYKYLWLVGGLVLTALTFIFGSNPMGEGPRLWLGCCGVYLQPSEPLKLLLVIYLAAYFADRQPLGQSHIPLVLPALLLTGFALVILLVQRDLGTASIFIFLYTAILFLATGRKRIFLGSLVALVAAGMVGYFAVDVIKIRLEAWVDPWASPGGTGYQVIQSLMAVANGGIIGRGPGLGYPGLVPVAISDFIFAAIAEETGLIGTIILLGILLFLVYRSMRIALNAPDNFRRLLAAGLGAYFGAQSILIIGGNLRVLPLTGVTLPFVSYGGSSLLTSSIAALILLLISSNTDEDDAAPLPHPAPYLALAGLLGLGFVSIALANTWWSIWRADDLLARSDNPRRAIADFYVPRGELLDYNSIPINETIGEPGNYGRNYLYPDLGSISGYTNYIYGQSGLEFSLDAYLRGLQGNPAIMVWWNHLLYGTPPAGLDVRTSIDLDYQKIADQLLENQKGAVIMMNADNGEILVMASHPTFDPNNLDKTGTALAQDPSAPLLNRAAQGQYIPGTILSLFLNTAEIQKGIPLDEQESSTLFDKLGFYSTPNIRLPVVSAPVAGQTEDLRLSPLQMALAAASLSAQGQRPPGQIAVAVNTPEQGWIILPALSEPVDVYDPQAVEQSLAELTLEGTPFWRTLGQGGEDKSKVTWFIGGTPPNWQGTPLVVVVALESGELGAADKIGRALLQATISR
jgi:cell division protein FtsW (lipid II flippase)